MGIVNELQECAERDDVLTVLRKAKRVASKLLRQDISDWVENELNGYKTAADLPDYRRIPSEFVYDSNGPIPAGFNMVKSGISRLGKMGRNVKIPLPDAIGAVMELIEGTKKGGGLFYPCDYETSEAVKNQLSHTFPHVIEQIVIMHQVDTPTVKDIPNQVKNRVLDWALSLERAGIHGEGHTFTAQEQSKAERVVFNDHSTKIIAGSVQGNVMANSPHATQTSIVSSPAEQAVQRIEDAVNASAEVDDVDRSEIKSSLAVVRDLATKEQTAKTKMKVSEKLAAMWSAVQIYDKLAPLVKPHWEHLMTLFR